MPSLIEILNQNTAQPLVLPQSQPSVLGTQATVGAIAGAQSGKAPAGNQGPARSSFGEQVQNQALQQGVRDVEQTKQAKQLEQTQQAAQQEQEQQLSHEAIDEQQLAQREEMVNKQLQILNDYSQGTRQLDLNRDKAKLEQLGFNMRLSNDQYVKRLNDEATKSRLQDAAQFDEALKRSIWADEEELLRDDFDFRAILAADDRSFKEQLANMDIQMAVDLAKADARQENLSNVWSGVSNVASGAVQAYGTFSTYKAPDSTAYAQQPQQTTFAPTKEAAAAPTFDVNRGFNAK